MKGAAWAAPVVAMSVAAPAFAASAECSPQAASDIQQSFAFDGSIDNWTQVRTPTAPEVRYSAHPYPALPHQGVTTNTAHLVDDPTTLEASTTTLTSPVACLGPGTYTFTFTADMYSFNARDLTLNADVLNVDTGASLANASIFTGAGGNEITWESRTLTVTVTQRTSIQFRYQWVFEASTEFGYGDDVAVTQPFVAQTA